MRSQKRFFDVLRGYRCARVFVGISVYFSHLESVFVLERGIRAALFIRHAVPGARTNVGLVPLSPQVDSGPREKHLGA